MGQGEEGEQHPSGTPGIQACQQESFVKLSRFLDSPNDLRERLKKSSRESLTESLRETLRETFIETLRKTLRETLRETLTIKAVFNIP